MDPEGHVYVTGYAGSKDFPVTENVVQPQHAGGDPTGDFGELDVFVTKFSPDGGRLIFSTYLGGSGNDKGEGIAVDKDGNVFVAGETPSTDFPIKNAFQENHAGGKTDFFVTKLSPNADKILWSTFVGGSDNDAPFSHALKVDAKGNVFVTGSTKSSDFPRVALNEEYRGKDEEIAVVMFKADGKIGFSTSIGGDGKDSAKGIAVDNLGNIFIVGETNGSPNFPEIKPLFRQPGNVFVMKLSALE